MEKKVFESVEQLAEYLNDECFNMVLATDCFDELPNCKVKGKRQFILKEGQIHEGLNDVVAIFASDNEEEPIEYILRDRDVNDYEYIVFTVDREGIVKLLPQYIEYVKDYGCTDLSRWLWEEDTKLSIDYDVMTTLSRLW